MTYLFQLIKNLIGVMLLLVRLALIESFNFLWINLGRANNLHSKV
jgi:uncharacterized membrane protein